MKQEGDSLLEGTRKLFPTDYQKLKDAMIEAAEEGELPVALQLNDANGYTLKDFEDVFSEFNNDTGLDMNGEMFLCPECKRVHVMIEVDYPPVDEDIPVQ